MRRREKKKRRDAVGEDEGGEREKRERGGERGGEGDRCDSGEQFFPLTCWRGGGDCFVRHSNKKSQ